MSDINTDFYDDLMLFIDQDQIDEYYKNKKQEVQVWLIEYVNNLKRIKEDQRNRFLAYAQNITFLNTKELNDYVQELTTVSKKDKARLEKYLQQIDWLPEGQNMGILEGKMVSRRLKDPLADKMLQDAFGLPPEPPEKESKGEIISDNRNKRT